MTDDLKTTVGEAGGRLRALVATVRQIELLAAKVAMYGPADALRETIERAAVCAAELNALLSAPVVSLPSTVSIVRCEHGGVQIEGHTALGDWELELDACGDIIELDKGSAPVVSLPPLHDYSQCGCDGPTRLDPNCAIHAASAPRGGGETRPVDPPPRFGTLTLGGEWADGARPFYFRATGDEGPVEPAGQVQGAEAAAALGEAFALFNREHGGGETRPEIPSKE